MTVPVKTIWLVVLAWSALSALAVAFFGVSASQEMRLAGNIVAFALTLSGLAWLRDRK